MRRGEDDDVQAPILSILSVVRVSAAGCLSFVPIFAGRVLRLAFLTFEGCGLIPDTKPTQNVYE